MRITAKQAGACTSCAAPIEPGQLIEWNRTFGARCLRCDGANLHPERSNSRVEDCHRCGLTLTPGRGTIEHHEGRWVVRCRERADCDHRADVRARG